MELKRLFFGMEAIAPWPEPFPEGRILLESDRHLTLSFLGNVDSEQLMALSSQFPKPPFLIGLAGVFDKPVFLPKKMPRVAAWHVELLEQKEVFLQYQKNLSDWLRKESFLQKEDHREFLSHVTIARKPFILREWKESFQKLPLFLKNVHLCESLGYSQYRILWQAPVLAPFEPMEHTADLAFIVRGNTLSQLHLHAQLSLSFHFPPLVSYFQVNVNNHLEQVVASLNQMISQADTEIGCPFKAVSFHGDLRHHKDYFEWEMIVDV